MSVMSEQAAMTAARVDAAEVGFDPATILLLITTLLPILLNCFKQEDEPDPARVKAAFDTAYERNPDRLRKRVRRQAERSAWRENGVELSKGQALQLADAVIAQARQVDETVATAAACEVP